MRLRRLARKAVASRSCRAASLPGAGRVVARSGEGVFFLSIGMQDCPTRTTVKPGSGPWAQLALAVAAGIPGGLAPALLLLGSRAPPVVWPRHNARLTCDVVARVAKRQPAPLVWVGSSADANAYRSAGRLDQATNCTIISTGTARCGCVPSFADEAYTARHSDASPSSAQGSRTRSQVV